ncbi:HEPN domain-containing protein [Methanoculleus bourgensis]|uniref:HEPN domain-containing protein n=1 Tax=Methanoculleus bourgensis TaxID=83986 RepID=UPI003B947632
MVEPGTFKPCDCQEPCRFVRVPGRSLLAQQAAEKALKAVCILHHIEYPYVHDLAALVTIIMGNGVWVPDHVKEAAKLTRFAITTRYPHFLSPVKEEEYRRAVAIAEGVVTWCESEIGNPGDVNR